MINPFPGIVSDRVWSLLFAWAEWRSGVSCPKSIRFPEVTYKWRLERGSWIGEPGFCLARSTRPRDPGIFEEFNQAFWDLEKWARFILFDLVEFYDQPLLRGNKWRGKMRQWGLSPRMYAKLLKDALRSLQLSSKARGIVN